MGTGGTPRELAEGHRLILASTFCQQYDPQAWPIHENRHKVYLLPGDSPPMIN
jgi:hypothetical protein